MKFKYKNDTIEVDVWLWIRAALFRLIDSPMYRSVNYEYSFFSFADYWQEIGKRNALVQFITSRVPGKYGPKYYTLDEVVQRIAKLDLGENPGVVLSNIDQSKINRLMHMFAGVMPHVFLRGEIIVFPANNKEAAYKLTQSIPHSIADVVAFADGHVYCSNQNNEE